MKLRISLFVFCIILNFNSLIAQKDLSWWIPRHLDIYKGGPMAQYLVISPGLMGPNSLPVPRVKMGEITEKTEFENSVDLHFSKGDQTQNLFSRLYVPFSGNRVAIELYGVPVEHYKMSDEVRDERLARDSIGKGYSAGDFYFSTSFLLLQENKKRPGLLIEMACKTASGSNLGNARFTDAPAYFFDASFGKSFKKEMSVVSYRPYGMLGFYAWQTNNLHNRQNDAVLFGAGLNLRFFEIFEINNNIGGYLGYQSQKDQPVVYRLGISRIWESATVLLGYQAGIHHFKYHTLSLKFTRTFNFQ